jgi:hypothetical protein
MKDRFEEIAKELNRLVFRLRFEEGTSAIALALKRVEKEGFERGRVSRENFRSIMCEYVPSIAEDSGQPEWSQGELDKAYDDVILGEGVWSKINESSLKQGGEV